MGAKEPIMAPPGFLVASSPGPLSQLFNVARKKARERVWGRG